VLILDRKRYIVGRQRILMCYLLCISLTALKAVKLAGVVLAPLRDAIQINKGAFWCPFCFLAVLTVVNRYERSTKRMDA